MQRGSCDFLEGLEPFGSTLFGPSALALSNLVSYAEA